jgi:hypothetical protein
MEKKTFYVSVGSGEITKGKGDFTYEFEINATEEEIDVLQELFDETADAELSTAVGATAPLRNYSNDHENDAYDQYLIQVYQMLHRLGTPETKAHIESMGILPGNSETEPSEEYPLG